MNQGDPSAQPADAATMRLRFEDHRSDTGGTSPPQNFDVALRLGDGFITATERIVCVETIKDSFGYTHARVWIEGKS